MAKRAEKVKESIIKEPAMTQYKTIAESNHFIVLDTIDIVGWALAHKLTIINKTVG